MRGLTPNQKRYVIDGCFHGDITDQTARSLLGRDLFYIKIDSPNGRAGFARLTPLGETVRSILKERQP
jgi:hypothetical protein